MNRDELLRLDKETLVDLVQRLEARVVELEAKLNQLPKTPRNSSTPPSRGQKANRPTEKKDKEGKGGTGNARALHPDPDRITEIPADSCPNCGGHVGGDHQKLKAVYDRIELPPVKPDVARVRQYQADCPCCGGTFEGTPPEGLEPGSPFGKTVQAHAVYLHTMHAISYERLVKILNDLFGLSISEGAIANMLARAEPVFTAETAALLGDLRQSNVIGSDETSARVQGRTWWQWLFCSASVVVHHIAPSRAKPAPGHRPGGRGQ